MRPKDAVDDAIDTVQRSPGCQSDGEPNLVPGQDSEDAHEREQYEHDDHRREVDHPGLGQRPPDGTEDRLGRLDHEHCRLRPPARIDIGDEDAREDQYEERQQQQLQEVPDEDVHEPESSSRIATNSASVPVILTAVMLMRSLPE